MLLKPHAPDDYACERKVAIHKVNEWWKKESLLKSVITFFVANHIEGILDTVGVIPLKLFCNNQESNPRPLYLETSTLLLCYTHDGALQPIVDVAI